ncbi:HD domain-containing protein [Vallitalea okinawensis]|uniref:HD domain-containing protein n=1 Tax=Vallitalea okinawensis TaxID=2078660 RepID=UPI000CFB368F|nr:HD domain-containing protein [Vallitalea okinawensis]
MEKLNKIFIHPQYQQWLTKIEEHEKERLFCKHDMVHFLNVARIAYILSLEMGLDIPKEYIYTVALLHDIGKYKQYEDGTKHSIVSAHLAEGLLKEVGFDSEAISNILEAIENHNNLKRIDEKSLVGIICKADKMSRECHSCDVNGQCYWDKDLKNLQIRV